MRLKNAGSTKSAAESKFQTDTLPRFPCVVKTPRTFRILADISRWRAMSLSNIRVVLMHPSHPGNIGAVARAMKTMSLSCLYLVNPKTYPSAEATARASGADDILARTQVCASLDEALFGCSVVFGASARARTIAWPTLTPRACAARMMRDSATATIALLIGCEHSGLTNEELERCHYLVNIPSNPDYSSLNIAAAVQVLAYEIHLTSLKNTGTASAAEISRGLATADEMERLYSHLEEVLIEIEFLDTGNPRQLMRRLRRFLNRAQPDKIELNILRGILTAVQRRSGT